MNIKNLLSVKINLWLLPALLSVVSCDSSDELLTESIMPTTECIDDSFRSSEEACTIALELFASENSGGRSAEPKRVSKAIPIYNSMGRSQDSKLLYYAVDYENDEGFAIIAAPKSVAPVIAVIDNGSFEDPENLNNLPYQHTLLSISDYINRESQSPTATILPFEKILHDTLEVDKKNGPNVSVAWGQAWPENIYTSNCTAGCAPVAVAQVLSFFELPKSMYFNNSSNMPTSTEILDWADMKKHSRSTLSKVPSLLDQNMHALSCECRNHDQIGKVVRQLGEDMRANYVVDKTGNNNHTSVASTNILPCLKKYLPNKTFTTITSVSSLQSSLLTKNSVAIINGTITKSNDSTFDHAWIADGAWTVGRRIRCYMRFVEPERWEWVVISNTIVELIHYNWGFGGNCNGFFKKDVFNYSDEDTQYDFPEHDSGHKKWTISNSYLIN
ncbi:MAG: C10 family peptidase [Paramuribaculum sp.]|nr:C10 family peptidase [Paramuribaculum sp.]